MTDDYVIGRGDAIDRLHDARNPDDETPAPPKEHVWEFCRDDDWQAFHFVTDAGQLTDGDRGEDGDDAWIKCAEGDLVVDPDAAE